MSLKRCVTVTFLLIISITLIQILTVSDIIGGIYCQTDNQRLNFTNFDNLNGLPNGCYIVPNIVHFIRLGIEPISYGQMITFLAAFKNQKPDKIYVHYNNETTFTGNYKQIILLE